MLQKTEPDDVEEWHNIERQANPQDDTNHRCASDVAVQELFPLSIVASCQRKISVQDDEPNICCTDQQMEGIPPTVRRTDR